MIQVLGITLGMGVILGMLLLFFIQSFIGLIRREIASRPNLFETVAK